MHWKAKRLLPALLDEDLDETTEVSLRVHVASCARCRRMQREFELSETLLRRLPISLLPMEYSSTSYGRLVSLSRWYDDPAIATPDRWRAPFLTAVSLAAVLAMALTVGAWSPIIGRDTGAVMLIAQTQDSSYLPMGWSVNRY